MVDEKTPPSPDREAFEKQLPDLLKKHPGKFALFRGGAFVDVFDSVDVAYQSGIQRFGLEQIFIGPIIEKKPPETVPALMHGLIRAYV